MPRNLWLTVYRVLALLAVLTSSLLYVHYLDPGDSAICGGASGCETVRRSSGFSYFFGVTYLNVPLLGILAFLVLFVDSLGELHGKRLARMRIMAGLGGILALILVVFQALFIKAFCLWCMVVDITAVALAFTGIALHSAQAQRPFLKTWAWLVLLGAASSLPIVWHGVKPTPAVPRLVAELFVAGKINVVEFADFQCPHCRRLHQTLKPLLKEYGDAVRFKRLNMPLPSHAEARDAAAAAVCAEKQGKGDEMADLLFEGRLGEEHYQAYAKELKLSVETFTECLQDPSTDESIQLDIARFRGSGLRGLPTTFVGDQKISGARPMPVFKEAFDRAASGSGGFALPGWLFLVLCVGGIGATAWFGRVRDTS